MIELWQMAAALGEGLILGSIFYGGLWWTVQKALISPRPALWFFASFWLRIGISLAGFYFIAGGANGDWRKFIICLVGFISARTIVTRLTNERRHAN